MEKIIFFLISISSCMAAGCSSYDRLGRNQDNTELVPMRTDSTYQYFKYRCFADAVYPIDDKNAESTRMKWLEQWLSENGYSDSDYEIISRRPMLKQKGLLGSIYTIYYEVRVPKK